MKHSKLILAESLITCQEWAGRAVAKVACKCHQPATAGVFWSGVAESVTWYFRPCTNVDIHNIQYYTVYICMCFIPIWKLGTLIQCHSCHCCHSTPRKEFKRKITVAVVGASCRSQQQAGKISGNQQFESTASTILLGSNLPPAQ